MLQKTEPANGENGRQQAAEEAARQASLTYVSDTEPASGADEPAQDFRSPARTESR